MPQDGVHDRRYSVRRSEVGAGNKSRRREIYTVQVQTARPSENSARVPHNITGTRDTGSERFRMEPDDSERARTDRNGEKGRAARRESGRVETVARGASSAPLDPPDRTG